MTRRAAFLLLFLPISACDCGTVSTSKVLPSLSMPAVTFAWGDVAVGTGGGVKSVTLTSLSSAAIDFTATVEGDADGVFTFEPAAPTTVPGRGMVAISMNFTPKAPMPYAATLVVTPAAPNTSNTVHRVPLTGIGDVPKLSFSPSHLGFSAVGCPAQVTSQRCSDTESVTLTNTGIVVVTLSSVSVIADGANPIPSNLTVVGNLDGKTLSPMQTLTVPVLWQPNPMQTNPGTFTANLQIQSNAGDNPDIVVPLDAQALPAQPPNVCLNVLTVRAREYVDSSGTPTVQYVAEPPTQWQDMSTPPVPTTIHVRPGWEVALTSLPVMTDSMGNISVDMAAAQSSPCTNDPQGLLLSRSWSLTKKPTGSRTPLLPVMDTGVTAADAQITIDAVGTYEVSLTVSNPLNLSTTVKFTLDAVPQDDLLATTVWTTETSTQVDLDLHLLLDSGPDSSLMGKGNVFCNQDCFFYNPAPTWFTGTGTNASMVPRLLYDDQGNPGMLPSTETIDLVSAPQPPTFTSGSTYRVAVYYFTGTTSVTPTVTIQHLGTTLATYTASRALMNQGDVWYAAEVDFTPSACGTCMTSTCDCTPTVTPLDMFGNVPFPTPPPTFGNPGGCN